MQQPKDIAIAALKKMLAQVGADAEFPGDAIWQYADEDVDALRKPPVFKMLSTDGYIEDTGEKTNAVTPDRRSAPTTKYRFGPLLRPTNQFTKAEPSLVAKAFSASCNNVLKVQDTSCIRLCASLLAKRFVIFTGLSGSGKTLLAQAFSRWITPEALDLSKSLRIGDVAGEGDYQIVGKDSYCYKIKLVKTNKTRTLSIALVDEWFDFIQKHPELTKAEAIRDVIKIDSPVDPYEHGYAGMLFALCKLLAERNDTSPANISDALLVVSVGADWTSNENLLGYPDALKPGSYRKPDSGVLDLILRAKDDPDKPYFLILDEMNLSHVERYFADFLSSMESGEAINLHDDTGDAWGGVPAKLKIPDNLFVIGTVNVDETTYMFSPKVLDRANVIEFRVSHDDMVKFLLNPMKPNLETIEGQGTQYAEAFVAAARQKNVPLDKVLLEQLSGVLMEFFPQLKEAGAEFGYRTAHEIYRLVYFYKDLSGEPWNFNTAMDSAIMQKLLPKLHGSKKKLGPVLNRLLRLCLKNELRPTDDKELIRDDLIKEENAIYWASLEKLGRMQKRLQEHGFTSFAEA